MMTDSDEELKNRRERRLDQLESVHRAANKATEREDPLVRDLRELQKNWWMLGNYSVLLGDTDRARRAYATSGLYTRALRQEAVARWEDLSTTHTLRTSVYLHWGYLLSVLSGSAPIIDALGTDIRTMSEDYPTEFGGYPGPYWMACTLTCLVQGDDDAAREYLERYTEVKDDPLADLISQTHEGLLSNDESATQEALQAIADGHDDHLGDSRSWRAAFSHVACAHLLVARHRGMDITAAELDSDAVPLAFDAYDIGDNLDLPTPEYVDADLIPEPK